jgi:hypothetical protein
VPELSKTIWIAALAKLALHLFSSARGYGIFGDEFYYLACAAHPDTGYVDHPRSPSGYWRSGRNWPEILWRRCDCCPR